MIGTARSWNQRLMEQSPRLGLPYIAPHQAQGHVLHNEAIRTLDSLVQLSVNDRSTTAPPPAPAEGDQHIIAPGATGAWDGRDNQIAAFQDGAWAYLVPKVGWQAWVAAEGQLVVWDGAGWTAAAGASVNPAAMVGVNTLADPVNRLSVKSDAVLFSHDDVTPGTGDVRATLNKAGASATASFLFQSQWSGRAEFGLTGDDDFRLKVTPDGSAWNDAVVADATTGRLRFPMGVEHAASRQPVAQFIFTPGGDGEVSILRFDRTRSENPRQAPLAAVGGDLLTLSQPDADLFFHRFMRDVSLVRVWNVSKTPPQPAWLKWDPAWGAGNDQLQVSDPAHIAGWQAGETIQIGDESGWPGVPAGFTRGYALDISPMLLNRLGTVFPQAGLTFKCTVFGIGARTALVASPSATPGSFSGGGSLSDGQHNTTQHTVPTTLLSPVSNSNLLYVREDGPPGALGTMALVVNGLWVS